MAKADHPDFNASFGGDHLLYHGQVNIGVAISLPAEKGGGLVVATIRDADLKSLRLSLPAGATGSLAAAPQCALADAQAGNCPESTRIGTIRNTVGVDATVEQVNAAAHSVFLDNRSVTGLLLPESPG